jgi:hypothetical protein
MSNTAYKNCNQKSWKGSGHLCDPGVYVRTGVIILILASTKVLLSYRTVLFDIFIVLVDEKKG